MTHVFISYKHEDSAFAKRLIQEVQAAGFTVWIDRDQLQPGENWREAINDAIKEAFALVVIVTPESHSSEYVTYEWAFALGGGVKIVPVLLRSTRMHPQLENLQHLDFSDQDDPPWDRLIRRLWELQGQHQSFTIPLARDAPSAVKTAVSALESHRADERRAALRTLAQMNHPAAYAVLVSAVRHPMRDVRVDAAFMLAKETKYQDAEAVPGLLDALTDDDPRVCLAAIDALGKIGDGAAVPDLLDILINEKDGDIRWTATNALGQIGPAAVPGLREALRDEDWKVRRSAAEALWAMGEPEAVPDLIEALVDKNDVVRQAVQSALKAMGYVAVRGLTAALNARDPQIRQAVATVLIEIGTPEAVMAVQQWRGRQSK